MIAAVSAPLAEVSGDSGGSGPLSGVRVLELAHIVAGPTVGLVLAELGAEVVKVESPRGDQARRMVSSGIFPFLNRGKESVVLEVAPHAPQRPVFEALVRSSDVVIVNFAPDTVVTLRLDHESLREIKPDVVTGYVQGYLPGGPREHLPLLDEMAQMSSGLAYMTGPAGRPLRAGASIIDIGAATHLALGIVAALLERTRSGNGQTIVAGLFETACFFGGQHVAACALNDVPPQPFPSRTSAKNIGWGVYDRFRTSDDVELFVGIISDRQWERFVAWAERAEWLDARFASNAGRIAERVTLIPDLQEMFGRLTLATLVDVLETLHLPYAPIRTPCDLVDDPQLVVAGSLAFVGEDSVPSVRPPLSLRRSEAARLADPPALGEHTHKVLRRLGVDEALIRLVPPETMSDDAAVTGID
jgi:crotonobetainyl-CoA:carnitine CoA-transferase CaiB-like acyl-CoA transferase